MTQQRKGGTGGWPRSIVKTMAWTGAVAWAAAAMLPLAGCQRPSKTNPKQRIINAGLVAEYDSNRDRIVRFAPKGYRTNLLHTDNLEESPRLDGQYIFFGGAYSWIAPQSAWSDESGAGRAWPPDPAMDTGPALVTRHGLHEVRAVGPITRAGWQENKSIRMDGRGFLEVTHGLTNRADAPQRGGVWFIHAVRPGSHIAVLTPEGGWPAIGLSDHPDAARAWEDMAKREGRWTVISCDTPFGWWSEHGGGEFKAYVPSDRVVAVHNRGRWLLRVGEPVEDPATEGGWAAAGEASVEVYANYGLGLFEAELLGAIDEVAPGETTEHRERWYLVQSMRPDLNALDEALRVIDPVRFPMPMLGGLDDSPNILGNPLFVPDAVQTQSPPPATQPERVLRPVAPVDESTAQPADEEEPAIDLDDVIEEDER